MNPDIANFTATTVNAKKNQYIQQLCLFWQRSQIPKEIYYSFLLQMKETVL
jgi:hypothetical protein